MLQQDKPEDFVIATGVTTEIREMLKVAFEEAGVEIEFKGEGEEEKGFVVKCENPRYQLKVGQTVVEIDKRYFRPTEVDLLIGDAAKAREKLGWETEYDLRALVREMIESDLKQAEKEVHLKDGGYKTLNYYE
jgi:GDPmannose 4,6-dehydratase